LHRVPEPSAALNSVAPLLVGQEECGFLVQQAGESAEDSPHGVATAVYSFPVLAFKALESELPWAPSPGATPNGSYVGRNHELGPDIDDHWNRHRCDRAVLEALGLVETDHLVCRHLG
jgi:hypothetical protein